MHDRSFFDGKKLLLNKCDLRLERKIVMTERMKQFQNVF